MAERAQACVHELVEARASAHPSHVAVECGDQVLTYRELSERTSRLAHYLASIGFPNPSVGILLPRSAEFVIAALAALKVGGSYTPLDADYPLPRLKAMITAARCPIVITATPLLGSLPAGCELVPVCLDTLDTTLAALPADGPSIPVHPDLLAYTMFTSGSTGVPKGVMVTHRGVVRLVGPPGIVDLTSDDIVLHVSSVSFDAATFDIWSALTAGATLIVAPAGRTSVVEIGGLISKHKVTTVLLPTGLFHLMVDERADDLRGLRQVVVGGDVLSAKHARRFMAAVPGCPLVNAYGPTEVTVATTVHAVAADHPDDSPVPIGQAMPGTYVRLLDGDLRPVPAGSAGELFAGGLGLARGYLDDPVLTAQLFVPDPWLAGARMYATGDLARQRSDGSLEFLGRTDGQFKKRGFRVEVAEIESALRADSAVKDAAVLADGQAADTRRLVAALVPVTDPPDDAFAEGVRKRLRQVLPEYLVPDAWLAVPTLPLTPNGKVDRSALLAMASTTVLSTTGSSTTGSSTTGPGSTSAEESELTAIWKEILSVDHVGSEDNFFELGGHSLLANKVIAQVRKRLGVELPLDAIFDYPAFGDLVSVVHKARNELVDGDA